MGPEVTGHLEHRLPGIKMKCKRTASQDIQGEQRQDSSLEEVAFDQALNHVDS